jgi:hypothetical protein
MQHFKQLLTAIARLRIRIEKMKSGQMTVDENELDVTDGTAAEDQATLMMLIAVVDEFYADLKAYAGDLIVEEGTRPEDLNASNDD